jgi:hypothetical protein
MIVLVLLLEKVEHRSKLYKTNQEQGKSKLLQIVPKDQIAGMYLLKEVRRPILK